MPPYPWYGRRKSVGSALAPGVVLRLEQPLQVWPRVGSWLDARYVVPYASALIWRVWSRLRDSEPTYDTSRTKSIGIFHWMPRFHW